MTSSESGWTTVKSALEPGRYFLQGDEACAEGAIAAGCDYYIVKRLLRHSFGRDVTHSHYIRLGNKELMKSLERYGPLRQIGQHSDKLLEGKGNYQRNLQLLEHGGHLYHQRGARVTRGNRSLR